jgi:hypothetical protein
MVLTKLSLKEFELWLREATDYDIKRKNCKEERIFSYDKPNKYRSDITNFIHCLRINPELRANQDELKSIIEKTFEFHGLNWREEKGCVDQYINDIINRNEVAAFLFSINSKPCSGSSL